MRAFIVFLAAIATTVSFASPWGPLPGQRAAALVAQMNMSELINQVHGQGMKSVTTGYVGSTAANSRLGIPMFGLEDGPQGVADGVPGATAYPSAFNVVQTWDPLLAFDFGAAQAAEQKAKGSAVLLGPGTNLARVPQGGRNFEYAGEDPYLASIFMHYLVRGIQSQNVSATIKHFFLNNQEHNRDTYSANVQQRAQMELYIKPFWAAVDAGVGSAMCSYNRVNGTYACENAEAIALLKDMRNFSGFLQSDWSATHSTVASALAGLDIEMPDSSFFGATLAEAVANGSVPLSRVQDMVTRIFTAMYAVGFMDDQPGPDQNLAADTSTPSTLLLAFTLAAQSTVLLNNENNILPLLLEGPTQQPPKSIAVLGDAATYYGSGSGSVIPGSHTTPYQAIYETFNRVAPVQRNASACTNTTSDFLTTPFIAGTFACFEGLPGPLACAERCAQIDGCNGFAYAPARRCNGWVWTVNTIGTCEVFASQATNESTLWPDAVSGTCIPAPLVPDPRGGVIISTYMGDNVTIAAELAAAAEVVIVSVAMTSSEGDDRPNLSLPAWQNAIVSAAAAVNNRTIAVVRAPGAVLMPWLNEVAAVTFHGLPGIQAAKALAANLVGSVNPCGKLPISFPAADNATWLVTPQQYPGVDNGKGYPDVDYAEGLSIGYRFYDLPGSPAPLFPFGFGLSYTTFNYSGMAISGSITPAGGAVRVQLMLANSGPCPGYEVAQLYVSHPPAAGEPPKILAGFSKVHRWPGISGSISMSITLDTIQVWNTTAQHWALVPGTYGVHVGSSSTDIRLTGSFVVL